MTELLAPAGSLEGVRAAVQSGADAVYLGFGDFNARRGAKNFSREEMARAISYCRARGVKTHITLNILVGDREREAALRDARFLYEAGADALIVQDVGLARLLRRCAPSLALHASTQMTISTLDGARLVKELGFSRVVLARETPMREIRRITREGGIETEIFVHGALCRCYSGQCWLSAVIGRRSGNRGLCAQPCRLPYRYNGEGKEQYPLSLKDLSLARHIPEIIESGVASLKIEGRMKRPEYTAVVTKVYADLLRERRGPTPEEEDALRRVFSRDGFTDGYFTGRQGGAMLGTKTELPLSEVQPLYDEAARRFAEGKETPRVPVHLSLSAQAGQPLRLSVTDGAHNIQAEGPPPEPARTHPTTAEQLEKALRKTGGTPFAVQETALTLGEGLAIPASAVNALRREALDALHAKRGEPPAREPWQTERPAALREPEKGPLGWRGFTLETRTFAQAEAAQKALLPRTLYLPLSVLVGDEARTAALAERVRLAAVLPRVFFDSERSDILRMLEAARRAGVGAALAGNPGQIRLLRELDMAIYGDFGLNAFNSDALAALASLGVERQTVSFELRLEQVRALRGPLETELIAYGRLPLMLLELCAIRRGADRCNTNRPICDQNLTHLTDRTGRSFPLLPEYGCRNTLLNSLPLALTPTEAQSANLSRLRFTIESPAECGRIAAAFASGLPLELECGTTRGLYRRGVE